MFAVTISDGPDQLVSRGHSCVVPARGTPEVAVPIPAATFVMPGTFTFSLGIQGENVLMIKVPLEREI